MKRLRIYVDTSVFGGCFDEIFREESELLFQEIKNGKFILVISGTTSRELNDAPQKVQDVLGGLPPEMVEIIDLGPASEADAEHIAAAKVAGVDFVVSWNFKHIVHYDKIRGFQAINLLQGYEPIQIFSPKEVVDL